MPGTGRPRPLARLPVETGGATRAAGLLAGLAVACVIALGVRSPTPWTGAGFVLVWITLFLAGSAWLPLARQPAASRPAWREPLCFVVLALAAGLATAVVLWSVAALVVKSLTAGTLAVLAAAGVGAVRLAHGRSALRAAVAPVPLAVAVLAFALGYHLLGRNELGVADGLVFTSRWDLPVHLYWASLIRELGLPLVDPAGIARRYMPLYHTGTLVALAGIEQLTATSPYQAARIFGIGALTVLALAGACAVSRLRLSRWQTVVCALAPLVWTGLSLPFDALRGNWRGIVDPYFHGTPPYSAVAGSMYHNLPQLGAVAVGAAALLALDRHRMRGDTSDLLLCGVLVGLSLAFKPSVAIVVGPAVLLVLCVAGSPWRSTAAFVAAVAAGAVLYLLPALFARLPAAPRWSIHPSALLGSQRALEVAALGVILPVALWRALEIGRARRQTSWSVLDVLLVALGGAMLFAALFVEQGRSGHGNHVWSRCAALVLIAPYAAGMALRFARGALAHPGHGPLRFAASVLAIAMLALQLATGALYAARYPTMRPARLPRSTAVALREITHLTAPADTLVADGSIGRGPGLPYLARRALFVRGAGKKGPRDVLRTREPTSGTLDPQLLALVARRDGAVIGPETTPLRRHLRAQRWTLRLRAGRYELWCPPAPGTGGP